MYSGDPKAPRLFPRSTLSGALDGLGANSNIESENTEWCVLT
jgi:hypothetical protein